MSYDNLPQEQFSTNGLIAHTPESVDGPRRWEDLNTPERVELVLLTQSQREGEIGIAAMHQLTEAEILKEAGVDYSQSKDSDAIREQVNQVLHAEHVVQEPPVNGGPNKYWIRTTDTAAVLRRLGTTMSVGRQRHLAYEQEKKKQVARLFEEMGGLDGLFS